MNADRRGNITSAEHIGRMLLGSLAAVGGSFFLGSASSTAEAVLELLAMITGLMLVVTGATGVGPFHKNVDSGDARRPQQRAAPDQADQDHENRATVQDGRETSNARNVQGR